MPSTAYTIWQKEHYLTLPKQRESIVYIESITINFWLPDARKCDLTNKAESLMDLLVDTKTIMDDSWQIVPKLILISNGIDRENPRAEIEIKKKEAR